MSMVWIYDRILSAWALSRIGTELHSTSCSTYSLKQSKFSFFVQSCNSPKVYLSVIVPSVLSPQPFSPSFVTPDLPCEGDAANAWHHNK